MGACGCSDMSCRALGCKLERKPVAPIEYAPPAVKTSSEVIVKLPSDLTWLPDGYGPVAELRAEIERLKAEQRAAAEDAFRFCEKLQDAEAEIERLRDALKQVASYPVPRNPHKALRKIAIAALNENVVSFEISQFGGGGPARDNAPND